MGTDIRRSALRGGIAACAVALALLAPATAGAQAPNSVPSNPSFDEYVPSLPASTGPRAPGLPGAGGQAGEAPARTSLPAGVRAKLRRAGSGGARLEALSTAPELGAPVGRLHTGRASGAGGISAALGAVGRAGGGALVLAGLVVLTTVGLVGAALAARRERRR
jgi:hypothetical protein